MAVVAVDEIRLLKTMRWWDGFVIGLACPGFILAGLAGSTGALGPKLAIAIWFASAVVGALQAYIYSEPAAMFPDKGGGLSMYAMEGWRKYFSLAGPIATFGYWFAWSSVLAIYGVIIGTLICAKYFPEQVSNILFTIPGAGFDVTWPRLIGTVCVLACFIFNVRGMRPAVWFSYATGLMMVIPVLALCIVPFLTGDFDSSRLGETTSPADLESAASQLGVGVGDLYADKTAYLTDFYGAAPSTLVLAIVWFWVIGWSTYGPEAPATFAPEYVDTARDTRLAIISTGIMNTFCALLLPIAIIGMLGYAAVAERLHVHRLPDDGHGYRRRRHARRHLHPLHLRRPAPVDEHRHDGRIAGALRDGPRGPDDQVARRVEPPSRAKPRHDARRGHEPVPDLRLPKRLLRARSREHRLRVRRTCWRSRACCSCAGIARTGRAPSASVPSGSISPAPSRC